MIDQEQLNTARTKLASIWPATPEETTLPEQEEEAERKKKDDQPVALSKHSKPIFNQAANLLDDVVMAAIRQAEAHAGAL